MDMVWIDGGGGIPVLLRLRHLIEIQRSFLGNAVLWVGMESGLKVADI